MKIFYELVLKIEGKNRSIFFGIPDCEEEINKMFKLRKEVYKKNNYINSESDRDEYDKNGKCVYFIAKIDDEIVGTARLILTHPLPTVKDCFDFKEPIEIKEIPPNKRGEISRLISVPYKGKIYLPRHLILLFLLKCICDYSDSNNLLGGYSFITNKLYNKINKLKVPFYIIKEFKQKYLPNGLMYPYFNQKNNRILPIYYKLEEVKKYFENLFENKKIFQKINEKKYILKDNLYIKFLRLLKII